MNMVVPSEILGLTPCSMSVGYWKDTTGAADVCTDCTVVVNSSPDSFCQIPFKKSNQLRACFDPAGFDATTHQWQATVGNFRADPHGSLGFGTGVDQVGVNNLIGTAQKYVSGNQNSKLQFGAIKGFGTNHFCIYTYMINNK